MNSLLFAQRFELVGDGAIIAEQAVTRLLEADYTGEHFTTMQADTNLDLGATGRVISRRRFHHEQAHPGHLQTVELRGFVKTACHYVRVAYCLYLVDVE